MLRTFLCADMDVFALIPIHIALDAEGGAYMFFAVHELTHKIKSENADAYRLLSDFVLDKLEESELYQSLSQGEGSTLEERIASVQALYEKRGQTLSREEAIEQIVCDAIPVILSDEQTVLEFVRADRTLAQRVYDFFEKFYNELTQQLANLVYGSANKAEYAALSNDAETVREIADLFKAALEIGRSAEINESDIDRQYAELEEAGSAIEEGDSGRRKRFSAKDVGMSEEALHQYEEYVENALSGAGINKEPATSLFTVEPYLRESFAEKGIRVRDSAQHEIADNDIRHLINSHGIQKDGIYGVTPGDIKAIPYIIHNADAVYDFPKDGKRGVLYVLDDVDTVYYVEAIAGEKAFTGKQMIKAPKGTIPKAYAGIVGNKEAFIASPNGSNAPRMYVQDVTRSNATNTMPHSSAESNPSEANAEENFYDDLVNGGNERSHSMKSDGGSDFYDTLAGNDQSDRRAEYDAQQREILSEWEGEGRTASLATSEKVFRNLAKSILQKASSRYSVDSFTDDLKALFHMVGDQARTETQRIARKVLNQSSARDDTMYDATYDARRYFRRGRFALSEKQKREAEIAYDGYNNYRRSLMGKLNLKNDGIPLDQAWGEICEMFPGYFEEDTKEGDQPQKVKEFLDAAYERPYINPYGTRYNIDDAASGIADELLAAFSNIRQRKPAESQPDNESQTDKERETKAKTPGEKAGFSFERPTTRQGRLQKAWEMYDNNMNPQKYYEQSAEKTRQLREMKLFEDGKTSDEMFDLKTNNLLRGLMLRNGENVGGALADNSMQRVTEIFSRAKKRLAIPSAASALELFRRRLLFLHEQQPDCHDHGEDQQIPSCAHAMRDRRRIDHECRAYHGGDGHDKALEHRHFLFPLHEHHKDGQIHCVDRNDRKLRGIKRDRTEPRVLHQISAKEIGQPDGAQHHAHNG